MSQFDKKPLVFDLIDPDLCVGCGLCAGICPAGKLEMVTDVNGELRPALNADCDGKCGRCSSVCPMLGSNPNEDALAGDLFAGIDGYWSTETGFVLNTFVGYRNDAMRKKCASGGLASWTIEALFAADQIDYAVCAIPTGNPDQLFDYAVLRDKNEVCQTVSSVYYPTELSRIICFILANPGRYAVTALPCFVKALRLAQRQEPRLQERISFVLGLTCGQIKNKKYTAYLAACSGIKDKPQYVCYRGKTNDKPASNFLFTCHNDHENGRDLLWADGPAIAWTNRWFTPKACDYCDDIFAELADATFMDAWLPEYTCDSHGNSLVITRNMGLAAILSNGAINNAITLNPIHIQEVIKSQLGVVDYKRRQLAYRLRISNDKTGLHIKKRVDPSVTVPLMIKLNLRIVEMMRLRSRDALFANGRMFYPEDFRRMMLKLLRVKQILNRIDRLLEGIRR